MENYLDLFREELSNDSTNYFIFDTKGKGGTYDDIDFEVYSWNLKYNKQVKEGDLFIYRRQQKASELNGQFYFFGAGKISKIESIMGTLVRAKISKPVIFKEPLLQEELEKFQWSFRIRGENWGYFFNQYGMTKFSKQDFENLLKFKDSEILKTIDDINEKQVLDLEVKLYQKQRIGDYSVEDKSGSVKVRGAAQQVFANQVKLNYGFQCAITGIKTKEFLVASHIIPWAADKENRLNPRNGICLSPLLDKSFDKGYISFSDSMRLIIADKTKGDPVLYDNLKLYEGKKLNIRKDLAPEIQFLQWHRKHLFNRNTKLLLSYNQNFDMFSSK